MKLILNKREKSKDVIYLDEIDNIDDFYIIFNKSLILLQNSIGKYQWFDFVDFTICKEIACSLDEALGFVKFLYDYPDSVKDNFEIFYKDKLKITLNEL